MIHTGDCVEVMAGMEPDSFDAIVTDPPYGLEFMGKEWDRLGEVVRGSNPAMKAHGQSMPVKGQAGHPSSGVSYGTHAKMPRCRNCGKYKVGNEAPGKGGVRCKCPNPDFDYRQAESGFVMQAAHHRWATEALRVAKPGAYLLAFGGTRTVHRLTVALEDAGWIIRDLLVWAYASGFPKSKASLKPAWEPIVLARKPGPLRELGIDACRIDATVGGTEKPSPGTPGGEGVGEVPTSRERFGGGAKGTSGFANGYQKGDGFTASTKGRWPANVILTDPIFDGGWEGVVGGGEQATHAGTTVSNGDTGTYSRFFLVPKASRSDREPKVPGALEASDELRGSSHVQVHCVKCGRQRINVPGAACKCDDPEWVKGKSQSARRNTHPTVKPTALMRHLVRLVTPPGGTVLDPFLGSGSTALAAEQEGFAWVGIEREPEYVAISEQRLVEVQRGLGLSA